MAANDEGGRDWTEGMVSKLTQHCTQRGFDLSAILCVGDYNRFHQIADKPELRLPGGNDDALAVVIGNTRAMWDAFAMHLSTPEGSAVIEHADPLDEYTKQVIEGALQVVAPSSRCEVVYAFETVESHGRCCSVHTVGHLCGMAYYDAEHSKFSLHPTYGPWFAFRAVLVFPDIQWAALKPAHPPAEPACPCPEEELRAVAEGQQQVMSKWGSCPEQESWDGLLRVTDLFTLGAEHRYGDLQARYHYTPDPNERRKILRDAAEAARSALR